MPKSQAMQLVAQPLTANSFAQYNLVVLGVYDNGLADGLSHAMLAPHSALIARLAREERFTGSFGQRLLVNALGHTRVVVYGMGSAKSCTTERLMALGGTATRLAHSFGAEAMALLPPQALDEDGATALAKGAHLGHYRYDVYRGEKAQAKLQHQGPRKGLSKLHIHGPSTAPMAQALKVGAAVAMAVRVARDLVNCPPNYLYPESFAAQAGLLAKKFGVKIKVLPVKELHKRGMGMLLGVGMGSERPPCLVHLSYTSRARAKEAPTLLVGKGITFDSGGLCIKGCDAMNTMKMDMGGAAAVLATVLGAAALKLDVHVEGVLALAENMPSGHALRTGDILRSAHGLTVEVNNTDAEGRLVLGDALHYGITTCAPKRVVDVATLTGACMVALGPNTTGLFANNDTLASELLEAARVGGEHMWRMPLTESLADQLRSDVADMRNTGDRLGGAITAALFLQRFVGDVPWAHLDIAGPAWANSESSTRRKGGTGAAVSSLMALLLQDAASLPEGSPVKRRKRGH